MSAADYDEIFTAEALRRILEVKLIKPTVVAIPAVGAEVRALVPGGVQWEILSFFVNFTTSAVVSNRTVRLMAEDGDTNVVWRYDSNFNHAASSGVRYQYASGLGMQYQHVDCVVPLPAPPPIALGGWTLRTNTVNEDAGDAYGLPFLLVREIAPGTLRQLKLLVGDELRDTKLIA